MTRGEIYYANIDSYIGSEQGGKRPVLVIQNNVGNFYSPTTIVATITSVRKHNLPTHVAITTQDCNLPKLSTIMLEQVKTIDKSRLVQYVGQLSEMKMKEIDKALAISIGLK